MVKKYYELKDGNYSFNGFDSIPPTESNSQYQHMLRDVARGTAEIISYVVPEVTTQEQIDLLENSCKPYRLREAVLTASGKAWLKDLDDQIETLRSSL